MSTTVRGILIGLVAALALLVLLGAAFVYSGAYNVAASEPHTDLVSGLLGTLQEQSIEQRASEDVPLPTDSTALTHGLEHFAAMCVVCHGAPGVDRGEIGRGLNPRPPSLSREALEMEDGELVWVIKHGIKFTGMPAFGPTHSDEQLRQIAAFVRTLPELSAEEYARLVETLPEGGHHHGDAAADSAAGGGHTHAPGTAPHAH